MFRMTVIVFAQLAVLSACSHAERRIEAPLPVEGKPMALVDVTAVLGMRSGQVEVTFEAEMTDVEVAIWGVDELRLTSPNTLVHLETASRGEKRSVPVDFVPGAGTSTLAVSVTGTRAGLRRTRSVTFDLTPPHVSIPATGASQTRNGERVKVSRLP